MKVVILDGSSPADTTAELVRNTLTAQWETRGWSAELFTLTENTIGACAGDFFCWFRFPGTCNVNDDNRLIAAAMVEADLVLYLTPVTFGGYSSVLKQMVDHQIQNISPFFTRVDGESHHQKRYEHYADFLAIGWQEEPDTEAAAVFRNLVHRNSINFHAGTHVAGVLDATQDEPVIHRLVSGWLDDVRDGRSSLPVTLPRITPAAEPTAPPKNALLLVGSPKTRKSTSASLGDYLYEQLAGQGITTETIYIHTTIRSAKRRQALLAAVDNADLITLAFPLYVDALPGPVTEALELIAAHRQEQPLAGSQRLTAIANCGFPEAEHNDQALAIVGTFARRSGFEWAGVLALGGGQGLVQGRPLVELGGRTAGIRQALDLTAAALSTGHSIPAEAAEQMARPVIPHRLYTTMGSIGWRLQARQYGMQKQLRRRPYAA